MSRFQAQTNAVLDHELDELRDAMGLAPSQKADLLREMAMITRWVLRQAEAGRDVIAEGPDGREILAHPALDALYARPARLFLDDAEAAGLSQLLSEPPPASWVATVRRATDPNQTPPRVRWKR